MAYALSATKLQSYQRCPQAYYFQYEHGLKGASSFGSAALGTALHQTLAQVYGEWHYQDPLPSLVWLDHCWQQKIASLSPAQIQEGWDILQNYYHQFIASEMALQRPIAVEGRIQGQVQVEQIEFVLSGRYDRLDSLENGLELIDYKSAKETKLPDPNILDLQLGVYYLALEQHYGQALKRMSLLYLRTGEKQSYEANPGHKQQVTDLIGQLALQLQSDTCWQPIEGKQCSRCAYGRYCPALHSEPEPLPDRTRPFSEIQLALQFE
jgi:putative RecB family exonuclease